MRRLRSTKPTHDNFADPRHWLRAAGLLALLQAGVFGGESGEGAPVEVLHAAADGGDGVVVDDAQSGMGTSALSAAACTRRMSLRPRRSLNPAGS